MFVVDGKMFFVGTFVGLFSNHEFKHLLAKLCIYVPLVCVKVNVLFILTF